MAKQSSQNTPIHNFDTPVKDSSVQFMLAEFNRIQAGEIYNRSSGESRVNLYITLLSFTGASIVALWQLTDPKDLHSLQTFYLIGFIAFLFVSLIGTVTFRLLVERWRLTIIYLRKLARIRHWFLIQDVSLDENLAYTTDETYNSFVSKNFLLSSLTTLVFLLNSVSIATATIFISKLLFPNLNFLTIGFLGVIVAFIAWLIQRISVLRAMSKFEKDKYAAFPSPAEKKTKVNQ